MEAKKEILLDLEKIPSQTESVVIERSEFNFALDMPELLVRKRVLSKEQDGLVEQVLEGSYIFQIEGRQWSVVSEDWRLVSQKTIVCTLDFLA